MSEKPLTAVWSSLLLKWHSCLFSFFKSVWRHDRNTHWKTTPAAPDAVLGAETPARNSKATRSRCSCPWCWKLAYTRTALSNQLVLRRVRINQCMWIIGGEERCENTPGTWRPVTATIRLSKWLMCDRWVSESGPWMHRILMITLGRRLLLFFFFRCASSKSNGRKFWLI